MLLTGADFLGRAVRDRTAVGGFTAFNLETAQGIVAGGERAGMPVLLQAGAGPFRHAGRDQLAGIALAAARASDVPVGVHLDHSRSLDEIRACLELGYTSVMFDGSELPYEQNVELTCEVVAAAREHGAWVEAELGAVGGDEEVSFSDRGSQLTDPAQAAAFVAATGVDALAVAVGNVHGFTAVPPEIDLERLAAIRASTPVPLVLHGASGLRDDVLLACLDRGVAKVNVNTELRREYLDAVGRVLPDAAAAVDLVSLLAAGREAVAAAVARIVRTLGRVAPAEPPATAVEGGRKP